MSENKSQVRDRRFRLLDMLYLAMIIVPLVIAMLLVILTERPPETDGVSITGICKFMCKTSQFQVL